MPNIIAPRTVSDFEDVRQLCWEYRSFLLGLGPEDAKIVRMFYSEEKYTRILDTLEEEYNPPNGAIKLVQQAGISVGCGMYHQLDPGTGEIKRVFVRDAARGLRAGRALMLALIDQCRADGLSRIVMDTSIALQTARALYLDMGFQLRGPYQDVPETARQRMIFFEMDL